VYSKLGLPTLSPHNYNDKVKWFTCVCLDFSLVILWCIPQALLSFRLYSHPALEVWAQSRRGLIKLVSGDNFNSSSRDSPVDHLPCSPASNDHNRLYSSTLEFVSLSLHTHTHRPSASTYPPELHQQHSQWISSSRSLPTTRPPTRWTHPRALLLLLQLSDREGLTVIHHIN
jgi:hypothetical protein